MSPLWKKSNNKKLKTIHKRPSPKHINHILSFAQSLLSVQDKKIPFNMKCFDSIEEISLFISGKTKVRAGMTVEAAIVLPLFLFFFLNLCTSIEMMRLHGNLQLALWEVGNRMSVYGSILDDGAMTDEALVQSLTEYGVKIDAEKDEKDSWFRELAGVVWSYTYVKSRIIEYLGETYLEGSPLAYGLDGLQFVESNVYESDDCFEVVLTYTVSPLSDISGFIPFRMANRYYGHLWNGYEIPDTEEVVYITEKGEVYHTSGECTYLQLSVQQVSLREAGESRNANGEKYEACGICCENSAPDTVYITKEGNCYHYQRNCFTLKRTIISVTLSEVEQRRLCQRCEKRGD